MCTTAQNHENIHILLIYPSIDCLIKKNLRCPVQRTKTECPVQRFLLYFYAHKILYRSKQGNAD